MADWKVRELPERNGIPKAWTIDYTEDQEQVVDYVYSEDDAHLISAAPDMFEALTLALSRLDKNVSDNLIAYEAGMRAINKAIGINTLRLIGG